MKNTYNKEKNWVSNLPISYLGAVAHQEETDPGTHRLAGIIQVTEAIQVAEEVPEAGTTQVQWWRQWKQFLSAVGL